MPVAFNAVTTGSGQAQAPTLSHNPQGAQRVLLVALVWSDPMASAIFEQVTFGGALMSEVGGAVAVGGAVLQVFRTVAPAAGAAQVEVTFDASVEYALVAASYTGAHQVSPTGAVVNASDTGTEASLVVPGTPNDSMVFDALAVFAVSATVSPSTPHGGQVARVTQNAGSGISRFFLGASDDEGGGDATMAWTFSPSRQWAQRSFAIIPYVAPTVARRRGRRFSSRVFGEG